MTIKATKTAKIVMTDSDRFELHTGYRAKLKQVLLTELPKSARRFDEKKQAWMISKAELPRVVDLLNQFALEIEIVEAQTEQLSEPLTNSRLDLPKLADLKAGTESQMKSGVESESVPDLAISRESLPSVQLPPL